jgi:hypothetical protein
MPAMLALSEKDARQRGESAAAIRSLRTLCPAGR